MRRWAAGALLLAGCGAAEPGLRIEGPAVLAVYAVPSDSLINASEDVASLYDDYMYYWAEARPRLNALGVRDDTRPLEPPLRTLRLRSGGHCWRADLPPGEDVGYLLTAPAREPRLLTGVTDGLSLEARVREYLHGASPGTAAAPC
jgi:hypothetical protein